MSGERASGRRIVVGVDGSPISLAALAWAVREAGLTGDSVEAVMAWQALEDVDDSKSAARVLSRAISQTVDPDAPVKVSATVAEGYPEQVLLEVAAGADLLVVGSRGHCGLADALLGSVSRACVHRARCPVVIVRAPEVR